MRCRFISKTEENCHWLIRSNELSYSAMHMIWGKMKKTLKSKVRITTQNVMRKLQWKVMTHSSSLNESRLISTVHLINMDRKQKLITARSFTGFVVQVDTRLLHAYTKFVSDVVKAKISRPRPRPGPSRPRPMP